MSADEVRSAYDAIAADYAAAFPTTEPEAAVDLAVIDHLVELLRVGGPTPRVLDAGCGTGRMTRYLTDRGCVTVGMDLSPGMLAMARRDHPDLPVHLASVLDLPFGEMGFDGVLLWCSLIHLTDDTFPRALAEAARVIRPGGLALVAFQVGGGSWDVGAGLRRRGHDVSLVRHQRTPDHVAAALAEAGLAEEARLVRGPVRAERHPQAFVLARRPG
ncbi:MAG: class I SAM-dependent methyltransferase [Phycicoccus sp.]